MRFIKVLGLVIVFFLTMVFFQQNTAELSQTITLKFDLLFQSWSTIPLPIYFLILGAFALGAMVVILFFFVERIRLGAAVRKARKQSKKLEKEVNALRTQPLEASEPLAVEAVSAESEKAE
ncbi:LapA family protein [Desulfovibrio mangrovi]|uniref:LapA family protein n=1 Tax=Desulfovibrio mangrovi TaxID=2976983 RepID=UPI00224568AE|nr:LapA family protein [Desulfovibrio mangrovi]UZP68296.1 LapA family protein [Desulfovibrio mangrovi]